jgi:ATP/ADP translocase
MARARVRRRALGKEGHKKSSDAQAKWFDRYDVLMILAVIAVQTATGGLLRKAGWSEGTVSILPLIMFAAGILLKPRVVEFVERRRKTHPADADCRSVNTG